MTPNELVEAARCYDSCIPPGMQSAVIIHLLQEILARESLIPNAHTDVTTPQTTTSATLVDVPGSSIFVTLTKTTRIQAVMAFDVESVLPGTQSIVAGFAISINGIDSDEVQRLLSGSDDRGIGACVHASPDLNPGTYEIKGRFRRVSGTRTLQMDTLQISAVGMQVM